jgi:hypothetical protein
MVVSSCPTTPCGRATPETALWRLEGQGLWVFCLTIFLNHSTLSLKIFSTFRSSNSIAGGPSLKAVEAASIFNWPLPTNQGRGRTRWSQGRLEIPVVQLSFVSAGRAVCRCERLLLQRPAISKQFLRLFEISPGIMNFSSLTRKRPK